MSTPLPPHGAPSGSRPALSELLIDTIFEVLSGPFSSPTRESNRSPGSRSPESHSLESRPIGSYFHSVPLTLEPTLSSLLSLSSMRSFLDKLVQKERMFTIKWFTPTNEENIPEKRGEAPVLFFKENLLKKSESKIFLLVVRHLMPLLFYSEAIQLQKETKAGKLTPKQYEEKREALAKAALNEALPILEELLSKGMIEAIPERYRKASHYASSLDFKPYQTCYPPHTKLVRNCQNLWYTAHDKGASAQRRGRARRRFTRSWKNFQRGENPLFVQVQSELVRRIGKNALEAFVQGKSQRGTRVSPSAHKGKRFPFAPGLLPLAEERELAEKPPIDLDFLDNLI